MIVEGRVFGGSGIPVAGARVAPVPFTMLVHTDAEGRFRLEIARAQAGDSLDVIAYADGYEPSLARLAIGGRDTVSFDFTITPLVGPPPGLDESLEFAVWTMLEPDFCMVPGAILTFSVRVRNSGNFPVPRIAIQDQLEGPFSRGLEENDIRLVAPSSSDPRITLDEERLFAFEAVEIPPTGNDFVELYSVRLPSASYRGVWCNAIEVEVEGAEAIERSCFATTLALRIRLDSQDGVIDAEGRFDPAPEVFSVGDGGPETPDGLVYRLSVENDYCYALPDGIVTDVVGEKAGGVAFREAVAGYPTHGSIESTDSRGFRWVLGTLEPGERASLLFRAEARVTGEEINRMTFSSDVLGTSVYRTEATIVR